MGGCLLPAADSALAVSVSWRQGYTMQGMAVRSLAAGVPLGGTGRLQALYRNSGADYREQQAVLGYRMAVAQWLTLGVFGTYSHIGTSDPHYRPQQWIDAGAVALLRAGRTGAYLAAGSRRWDSRRPWMLVAGASWRPVRSLLAVAEVSAMDATRLRCGMEYTYDGRCSARAGFATAPLVLTFGVGYRQARYTIDLSTEVHRTLGLTPQLSLGLCL